MPSCFIAMPVSTSSEHARVYGDDQHFHHVLEHLMVPAVARAGYDPIKPIATGADVIHAKIIRQLETADMVLCDISTLNPNVFFEFGVRTAVDKPVGIVRDIFTDPIPFDTSIMNVHTYEPSLAPWLLEEQVNAIADHLQASEKGSRGQNTLWKYFGLTTRAAFKNNQSGLDEKVDLLLLQMKGLESATRSMSIPPLLRQGNAEFQGDVAQTLIPYPKDITTAASEFVNEAQQLTRARISEAKFGAGAVLLIFDGPVSVAERVHLGSLGHRHGSRIYVDDGQSESEIPGE